jgi:hypothetical protein
MSAPFGNKHAAKSRIWEQAIKRALSRAEGTVDKGLDRVADKLVAAAIEGDPMARMEIGNRMDGKASEHVHIEQDLSVSVGHADLIAPKLDLALASRQKPTVQ